MRLANWNANSIRNKKLELVQFLSDHGIDICLINETYLVPGQYFRMPNYIFIGTVALHGGGGVEL